MHSLFCKFAIQALHLSYSLKIISDFSSINCRERYDCFLLEHLFSLIQATHHWNLFFNIHMTVVFVAKCWIQCWHARRWLSRSWAMVRWWHSGTTGNLPCRSPSGCFNINQRQTPRRRRLSLSCRFPAGANTQRSRQSHRHR